MGKILKNKRGIELATSCSSGYKTNSEKLYLKKEKSHLDFFLIGLHSMQGLTATTRHGVTRKRSTKRPKHTVSLFKKNLQLKGNSGVVS